MEFRDYLRMLRRGWPTVVAAALVCVVLGVAYLAVSPQRWQASAVIFVSPNNPQSFGDLQLGAQYAVSAAPTTADLVRSSAVLGPVADDSILDELLHSGSGLSVEQLEGMVVSTAREGTSLVDVTVTAGSGVEAAQVANAVAASATSVIPSLVNNDATAVAAPLVDLQVVRTAPEPTAPLSPVRNRVLALALVVGIALGLTLTIARQALDNKLRRPEDLRSISRLPLLGVIPRLRRAKATPVVVRDVPSSPAVEAYRVLRTNLRQLDAADRRSIVFAPVRADKSAVRVPVNLAWSLAQSARRVLLMDLDLRQSAIADLLGLDHDDAGTADILIGSVEPHQVVRRTSQPFLDVVVSGSSQDRPSDLLSGPWMERMVRQAEQEYDYVVLNVPPLLDFTDAAVAARVAGHTVVTFAADRTPAPDLAAAVEALANVQVEALGSVMSDYRGPVGTLVRSRGTRAAPAGVRRRRREAPLVQGDQEPTPPRADAPDAPDPVVEAEVGADVTPTGPVVPATSDPAVDRPTPARDGARRPRAKGRTGKQATRGRSQDGDQAQVSTTTRRTT